MKITDKITNFQRKQTTCTYKNHQNLNQSKISKTRK